MKLTYNASKQRYEIQSRYEERETIKKAGGFLWDRDAKCWHTKFPEKAARLIAAADPIARRMLESIANQQQEALAASSAHSTEIEIPAPPGLSYYPFQTAGIAYALGRKSTLLAEEQGLGKSVESIGYINALRLRNVLIVAPASLKVMWTRFLERWLVEPRTIGIAASTTVPDTEIVVANYDILGRNLSKLTSRRWDLIIYDESQYLKTSSAQRTKAAKSIAEHAEHILLLSGTAILNRPKELVSQLEILGAIDHFGGAFKFMLRYCDGHKETIYVPGGHGRTKEVWNFDGASHLEELQFKLRTTVMRRVLTQDVLSELPPLRKQLIPLPANGLQDLIDEENAAAQGWEADLEKLQERIDLAVALEDKAEYDAAVSELRQRQQVHFTEMSEIRHEVGLAKVPKVLEYVTNALDNVQKVAIWVHHKDVLEAIRYGIQEDLDNRSNRHRVRQVDRTSRSTFPNTTKKVDVSMPVRVQESSSTGLSDIRQIQGMHELSPSQNGSADSENPFAVQSGETSRKKGEHSVLPDTVRHRDSRALSSSGYPSSLQAKRNSVSGQPLDRQDRSDQGLHTGQYVDNQLAGEHNQARRLPGRAGNDRDQITRSHRDTEEGYVVTLSGDDPPAKRQDAVDRFQTDPNCRVFIGSMHAAGVGLTLTATNYACFAECDFTPGVIDQAMKRHHRIGQANSVLVQFLVLDGSLDARMTKMVVEKERNIYAAMDKPLEIIAAVPEQTPSGCERAETTQTPHGTERIIPEAQVEAMLRMLRILAGLDPDYASQRNDMGFSRFDGDLGHKFASLPTLTQKQAQVAKRILRRYWRQIAPDLYRIVFPSS